MDHVPVPVVEYSTWKAVVALLLGLTGAPHVTVTFLAPGVALTLVGAEGALDS